MSTRSKAQIFIMLLVLCSPLGLYLPARFGAGSAWGEWSTDEIQRLIGYVPAGMHGSARHWNAPMPDYALRGHHSAGLSYILSAALGVTAVMVIAILVGKVLKKREDSDPS